MSIDWSINIGTIIHLGGMLIGGFAVYVRISDRLTRLEANVETLMDYFQTQIAGSVRMGPIVRPRHGD